MTGSTSGTSTKPPGYHAAVIIRQSRQNKCYSYSMKISKSFEEFIGGGWHITSGFAMMSHSIGSLSQWHYITAASLLIFWIQKGPLLESCAMLAYVSREQALKQGQFLPEDNDFML